MKNKNVSPIQLTELTEAVSTRSKNGILKSKYISQLTDTTDRTLEKPSRALNFLANQISKVSSEVKSRATKSQSDTSPSSILTKWHSRGARLWLGTLTIDGLDYRTLEYEFDSAISPKWLKELERDKGFIQTALVAQEVRELSARYWAERKAEAQAKAEQIENEPEAESPTERPTNSPAASQAPLTPHTAPSIDWEYIDSLRAMQDALGKKLGASKATYAIYLATNEILTKWKGAGREETPEAIHQAALELLCLRHKIPFDDCFDTEISLIETNEEIEISSKAATGANAQDQDARQSESDNLTLGF